MKQVYIFMYSRLLKDIEDYINWRSPKRANRRINNDLAEIIPQIVSFSFFSNNAIHFSAKYQKFALQDSKNIFLSAFSYLFSSRYNNASIRSSMSPRFLDRRTNNNLAKIIPQIFFHFFQITRCTFLQSIRNSRYKTRKICSCLRFLICFRLGTIMHQYARPCRRVSPIDEQIIIYQRSFRKSFFVFFK